ncbi:MAG TPA: glycosyltransferase family 1 protein [Anaerolineae bacterium]|nr:glycosyltransferase family 1 protein [Anaerolineae bacterium]
MKRIRVLEIMEATGGGTKKHLELLVTHLDKGSFDVTVACPSTRHPSYGDESIVAELQAAGVRTHIVEMCKAIAPASDLASFWQLWSLMRRDSFDVIHTHSSKGGFLGRFAARCAGANAVVHTAHGFYFLGQPGFNRVFYLGLERLASRLTDRFIAVSESEKTVAIEHRLFRPDQVVVIENGIEPADLKVDIGRRQQELGLEPDRPVVGTVSRFNPQKDPVTLLRSFALVSQVATEVQFVWCGNGELKPQIESLAWNLGIHEHIVFTGYREDVLELMALFDIFVVSSLFEGLPYTLLEAMSVGKPVVATDVVGSRDAVVHGKTGLLVPPQDPSALAEAVLRLIRSPDEARRMGQAGRDLVARRFTLKRMITRTEQVYRELAHRSG